MHQLSDPDPTVPAEAYQIENPVQRIRFVRGAGGDLYIEIPGMPDKFSDLYGLRRGRKYAERHTCTLAEIQQDDGPVTIEWDSAAP